jgi:hypothetical protein
MNCGSREPASQFRLKNWQSLEVLASSIRKKPASRKGAREAKKTVCVLCTASTDDVICGVCADKIRAEAVEQKRWEEKGGR